MRTIRLIFSILCLCSHAIAEDTRTELRAWADGRWAVVEVRTFTGSLVMMHPTVGREIDLEEHNRFGVFQGVTEFNKKWFLPALTHPITGFQSARFLRLANGDYGIDVTFRGESGLRHEWIAIRDRAELDRICAYLNDPTGMQNAPSGYPMVIEENATFQTVAPRYTSTQRLDAELGVADGARLRGRLLPMIESGQMLIETPQGFRRVDFEKVREIRIGLRGGRQIVRKTVVGGIQYAFVGGLVGLMSGGFYEGITVKEQMLYGIAIGGAVGAAFGFLDGVLSFQPSRTFHLDAPTGQPDRELELMPFRIRLRF